MTLRSAFSLRISWQAMTVAADDVMKLSPGCLGILHRRCRYVGQCRNIASRNSATTVLQDFHPSSVAPGNIHNYSPCSFAGQHIVTQLSKYSTGPESTARGVSDDEHLSTFQRFKRTYKEHGKILVTVHVATAIVWYGSFYAAVRCGVDIVPWLEELGASDTLIKPFRAGGLGDFAVAYLIYKLASPLRYTVTLAGTNLVIRHRRSNGTMAPIPQEDSLKALYKKGRQKLVVSTTDSNFLQQERLKRMHRMQQEPKRETRKTKK